MSFNLDFENDKIKEEKYQELLSCRYYVDNFGKMFEYFSKQKAEADRKKMNEKDPKGYDFIAQNYAFFKTELAKYKKKYDELLLEYYKMIGLTPKEKQPGEE